MFSWLELVSSIDSGTWNRAAWSTLCTSRFVKVAVLLKTALWAKSANTLAKQKTASAASMDQWEEHKTARNVERLCDFPCVFYRSRQSRTLSSLLRASRRHTISVPEQSQTELLLCVGNAHQDMWRIFWGLLGYVCLFKLLQIPPAESTYLIILVQIDNVRSCVFSCWVAWHFLQLLFQHV